RSYIARRTCRGDPGCWAAWSVAATNSTSCWRRTEAARGPGSPIRRPGGASAQVVDDPPGELPGIGLGGLQHDFRRFRPLVGRVDAGEVPDLAGTGLRVQPLHV